jgi:hypothetical protein
LQDRDRAFDSAGRAFEGFISTSNGAPVPLWLGRALFSHVAWKNPEEALLSWRRCYHVQVAMARHPDDMKKICEHVEVAMAKDTAELKGNAI